LLGDLALDADTRDGYWTASTASPGLRRRPVALTRWVTKTGG
jgi:hypothetical protein